MDLSGGFYKKRLTYAPLVKKNIKKQCGMTYRYTHPGGGRRPQKGQNRLRPRQYQGYHKSSLLRRNSVQSSTKRDKRKQLRCSSSTLEISRWGPFGRCTKRSQVPQSCAEFSRSGGETTSTWLSGLRVAFDGRRR